MMDLKQAIQRVLDGEDLELTEMTQVMRLIMSGEASAAQIGGFLVGLRMKGESVSEITGAAQVMRELAAQVEVSSRYLVDTCGTGGDGSHTFNISTASALVAAAGGARVAKHGNRSASSQSGSADLLEAAGVNLDLTPAQVARCIDQVGIGFMFAVKHHSAMKHAIGARKELGVRTLFNVLGPLTNPAGAPNQVMGLFSAELMEPMAQVLKRLGSEHVLLVHGDGGLDEIALSGASQIVELNQGEIHSYCIAPEEFGFERQPLSTLQVQSVQESLQVVLEVLNNVPGAPRDVVCLNAGAALYASGIAHTLSEGVNKAKAAITSGAAKEKLRQLVDYTQINK
jgi:anthranilate phosphoribosyltransferase